MPFGMVSRVGRGMGVLDGMVIVEGNGQFMGELGRPIITNVDFATRLFPSYFGQDLFLLRPKKENTIPSCTIARRASMRVEARICT